MASNTVSIEKIINMFNDLTFRHKMLNSFSYGPTSDINASGDLKMPYLHIENTTSTLSKGTANMTFTEVYYDFDVYIMDRINKGDNNYKNTSSDTLFILQTIISEISQHPYWMAAGLSLQGDITTEAVFEATDENVNGHKATLRIKQPFRFTPCVIPINQIPGWTFSLSGNVLEYRLDCGCEGTGGGTSSSYYISLYDNEIHEPETSGSFLTFSTTVISNGISVQNEKIVIENSGNYEITYELNLELRYDTGDYFNSIVYGSLFVNGSIVAQSNWTIVPGFTSVIGTTLQSLNAGDEVELFCTLEYIDPLQNDRVAIISNNSTPSMILNIHSL